MLQLSADYNCKKNRSLLGSLANEHYSGASLLDEILSSELLCMEDAQLFGMFLDWGSASEEFESVLQLIAKHVDLHNIPDFVFGQFCVRLSQGRKVALERLREKQPREQRCARSQHCIDVLQELYLQHLEIVPERVPFIGYWVNVIPGDLGQEWLNGGFDRLLDVAKNGKFLSLEQGSITWFLPHTPFYMLGFSFETFMPRGVHFEISCSCDGKDWHVAMISEGGIPAGQLTPSHYPQLVQWIKLHVKDGFFHNDFQIHGIVPKSQV